MNEKSTFVKGVKVTYTKYHNYGCVGKEDYNLITPKTSTCTMRLTSYVSILKRACVPFNGHLLTKSQEYSQFF